MRKIIGLAWLLLFSGSAHALVIPSTIVGTVTDDEYDYYFFSITNDTLPFSIDVLAAGWDSGPSGNNDPSDGNGSAGLEDAELWFFEAGGTPSIPGSPFAGLTGTLVDYYAEYRFPAGVTPPADSCNRDGSAVTFRYVGIDADYLNDPCIPSLTLDPGDYWLAVGLFQEIIDDDNGNGILDIEDARNYDEAIRRVRENDASGSGGDYQLTITLVPEPSILALFGLGLLGLAVTHRRRKLS